MKNKINKYIFRNICIVVLIHFIFSMYYSYLILGSKLIKSPDFLRLVAGGIQVEDSSNLFLIILYVAPKCLLFLWITNSFVKDLKSNFLYIFLRTSNRTKWLNKTIILTIISVFYYEAIFFTSIVILLVCNGLKISAWDILELFLLEFFQMIMLAFFSNGMQLFLNETACVFGTLLELAVPLIITGVIYENHGMWIYPAKCIFFNWGNYNYMMSYHSNTFITVLSISLICILIYFVSKKKINKYEFM